MFTLTVAGESVENPVCHRRAWPQARYEIVADAGHSAFEPGIRSRLIAATEEFKTRL